MAFPLASVTAPTLSDYQYSFNGLTMGEGTQYGIVLIDGLDMPGISSGDVGRPRDTGQYVGLDVLNQGREIMLTVDVGSSTSENVQSYLTNLATAFIPPADGVTETPFWFQLPNLPLLCVQGRVRKHKQSIDLAWSQGLAKGSVIALHATDPRVYGPTTSTTVSLPTPLGGVTPPFTFPLSFGGGSTAGVVTVTNSGNIETRPIITITGPVTNPTITNATTGNSLSFSNPSQISYTLNAGDQLVIDLDAHQATYYPNGSTVGSSRRNWLQTGSTWFTCPPGTNTINFTSADASLPTPAPTMQVQYAPAYISAT